MGALMLLVPRKNAVGRQGGGDVAMGARRPLDMGPLPTVPSVHTGAQLIAPGPIAAHPASAFSLRETWAALMAEGRLFGTIYPGHWADVGHPEGLRQAEEMLAPCLNSFRLRTAPRPTATPLGTDFCAALRRGACDRMARGQPLEALRARRRSTSANRRAWTAAWRALYLGARARVPAPDQTVGALARAGTLGRSARSDPAPALRLELVAADRQAAGSPARPRPALGAL